MGEGAEQGHKPKAARLGTLPRPVALAVLAIWAGLTIAALIGVLGGPAIWSGEREALVPAQHRTPLGQPYALVRVDLDALASVDEAQAQSDIQTDPATILAEAGFAIEEALGDERVPLAPPKTEITRWLDAHALYLLPIEAHEELAARLTDARMLAEVQGLEARLSSPLFSVSGEQPRRDPLGIHALTEREAGRLGHVAEIPGTDEPQVSPSGDLIAAGGDRALIALRSSRAPDELLDSLRAAVDGLPVTVELIDPRVSEATIATQSSRHGPMVMVAGFAALVLLLSLVMRRLIPVLALGVCLASVWLMLVFTLTRTGLGGLELGSVALAVVALGFACDAALRLPGIGPRDWSPPLIFAGALAPLVLVAYPLWQRWAVIWAGAIVLAAIVMRVVLPALLELLRGDFEWRRPGFRLAPMPGLAIALVFALLAAGAWASQELRFRPATRLPTTVEVNALERELVEHFFDPTMIVEARTRAGSRAEDESPSAATLDAAAVEIAILAELVPTVARRIDSPASFVLPRAELEARKQALAKLALDERMAALDLLLVDQGLRAEAFAEFVRGAADIDDLPSAQAALDGPLGPWIGAYLVEDDDGVALRSRIELRGHEGLPTTPLTAELMASLPVMRGPAIAATVEQREFEERVAIVVLAGLWLGAFLIWLATGSLATALAGALVGLASEAGVVFGLSLLDQAMGAHLLPIVLLVGAAAAVAGARASRAVSLGQPIVARGLLLSGACQVAIGIVLLTSAQPLWRELGLALAMGSALACGLGLFATPGLARTLARIRRRPPSKPRPEAEG